MRQCHVYFIQEGRDGPIKIGYAHTDVMSRMRSMQTSNSSELHLLGTIPAKICDERFWHSQFHAERVRGEWFRPSDRLLIAIKKALKSPCEIAPVSPYSGNPFVGLDLWMKRASLSNVGLAERMGYSAVTVAQALRSRCEFGVGFAQAVESVTNGYIRANALLDVRAAATRSSCRATALHIQRKTQGKVPADSWSKQRA